MSGDVGTPTANPATNPTGSQRVTPSYQGSYADMFMGSQSPIGLPGGSKGSGAPLTPSYKPISIDQTKASSQVATVPDAATGPVYQPYTTGYNPADGAIGAN